MTKAYTPEDLVDEKEVGEQIQAVVKHINDGLKKRYRASHPSSAIQVDQPEFNKYGSEILNAALAQYRARWTIQPMQSEEGQKVLHYWMFTPKPKVVQYDDIGEK